MRRAKAHAKSTDALAVATFLVVSRPVVAIGSTVFQAEAAFSGGETAPGRPKVRRESPIGPLRPPIKGRPAVGGPRSISGRGHGL